MRTLVPVVAGVLVFASPALAHHPFNTEFDAKQPIQLTGKVTKLDWVAPHVTIHMSAKDDAGKMQNWSLEAASPADLQKMGWSKTGTLKTGEEITVHGYKAKSERFTVSARTIEAGGKTLTAANADEDKGPKS